MEYTFHFYNSLAETGALMALNGLLGDLTAPPVILCIGSDLAIGDSLGPVTGTLVRKRLKGSGAYVYGTLKNPVTAKEVKYINDFLRKTHPNAPVIAIDAAVGDDSDIGLIKVAGGALKPGSGANKRLGKVGDVSILGIVAGKSTFSYSVLNLTRLNLVYAMAEAISDAILSFSFEETWQIKKDA